MTNMCLQFLSRGSFLPPALVVLPNVSCEPCPAEQTLEPGLLPCFVEACAHLGQVSAQTGAAQGHLRPLKKEILPSAGRTYIMRT